MLNPDESHDTLQRALDLLRKNIGELVQCYCGEHIIRYEDGSAIEYLPEDVHPHYCKYSRPQPDNSTQAEVIASQSGWEVGHPMRHTPKQPREEEKKDDIQLW